MSTSRLAPLALALTLIAACGGGESPTSPDDSEPTAASLSVSPSSASYDALEDTTEFSAAVEDQDGNTISDASIDWSSTDPTVVDVGDGGEAVALANGTTEVVASAEGVADTATVTVDQQADQVEVSPETDTLAAGDSLQLSAEGTDVNGNVVADADFSWSSSDTSVATVDSTGFVRTKSDGAVDITVELDGATGASSLDVQLGSGPEDPPTVSSVSPSPMSEGESATVSGSNFDPAPGGNTITVDGVEANVVAATSTTLDIDVPLYDCLPARNVAVEVATASGIATDTIALNPDEPAVSLATGRATRVEDPAQFCLQFEETQAAERYLVGVQSLSNVATSLTPVEITAQSASDGSASRMSLSAAPPTEGGLLRDRTEIDVPARWKQHRVTEIDLRREERRLWESAGLTLASGSDDPVTSAISVGPSTSVGDTVSLRVPDLSASGSSCDNYREIGAVVKEIGNRAIVVADTANPSDGFTDADYRNFSDRIDQDIFSTQVTYFGEPSDLDGNGRIVAVFTKELNRTSPNTLGFVSATNLSSRSDCESSDEGEYFYGKVADPSGLYGPAYSLDAARLDAPFIMAHELTHIIQQSRRLLAGKTWMGSVIAEAQATLSEEVVGHSVTGRQSGQDYSGTVAFNTGGSDEFDWYANAFGDLANYFGHETSTSEIDGAPEECGWWHDSTSPCQGRAFWYGVGWSFLRWVTDRYGPDHAGGKTGFHRDLVDGNEGGLAMLETLTGESLEKLMGDWAASLYVDGRVADPDPALTTPSWDYFDIFENLSEPKQLNPLEVDFTDWIATGEVRASSAGYISIEDTDRPATAIQVRGGSGETLPNYMQIWVVRLE